MFRLWKSFCLLAQDEDGLHNSASAPWKKQQRDCRQTNYCVYYRGIQQRQTNSEQELAEQILFKTLFGSDTGQYIFPTNKTTPTTRNGLLVLVCNHPQDFGSFKLTQQHSLARIQKRQALGAMRFILYLLWQWASQLQWMWQQLFSWERCKAAPCIRVTSSSIYCSVAHAAHSHARRKEYCDTSMPATLLLARWPFLPWEFCVMLLAIWSRCFATWLGK